MKFVIRHELVYRYDSPVRLSTQYLRLTPRDTTRQSVLEWKLDTPGQPLRTTDGYGNVLHVLTLDKPVAEIALEVSGTVLTSQAVDEPSDFTGTPLPPELFLRPTALTRVEDGLAALAVRFAGADAAGLRELASLIRSNDGESSAADLAHAFIGCCRRIEVPARYVSGYVYRREEPAKRRADRDMSMHAWAEAWVQGRWRSFDVAEDRPIGESHVKIAVGADYLDACPIRGVRVSGGNETLVARAQVKASQQ